MEEELPTDSDNRTPLFILGAATLVLVIVGIVSFSKFVAAQKDPGNQASSDNQPSNQPRTPEEWEEYNRQKLRNELLESGGVVTDATQPAAKSEKNKLRGQVVDFSEQWNFVTINIGSDQDVKQGDQFYVVSSEDIRKGIVKVDQVEPKKSIALFITDNDFSEFLAPKQGDEIREIK